MDLFQALAEALAALFGRRASHRDLSPDDIAALNARLTDPTAIQAQLVAGNKIKAIKLYREQTGVDLKEAKEAVEAMQEYGTVEHFREQPASSHALFDPTAIQAQLVAGNKIKAIKLYREQTGVGLKEAKEAVEAMQAGGMADPHAPRSLDPDELHRLVHAGRKIEAIKYFRTMTGSSLKEAKEAVEFLAENMTEV